MAGPFYPVIAEVEGRRYAGNWTLKQGGRICVAWPNGSRTVDLADKTRPEARARDVLKDMVADWLEEQRRPPPKPPRRPRPPPTAESGKPPAELDALRALVAEIAAGDYRDPKGHQLVLNTAYLEAIALLELTDYLQGRPRERRD